MDYFSRTDSGLKAKHLFFSEKLVWVEGITDIPFYKKVFKGKNCRIEDAGGSAIESLADGILNEDLPYIVIKDGHYEILTRKRSPHKRVIILQRHSYENYFLEEEVIIEFCNSYINDRNANFIIEPIDEFEKKLEKYFRKLLILDIAHQLKDTGTAVFPDKSDRFIDRRTNDIDFRNAQIRTIIDKCDSIEIKYLKKAIQLLDGFLSRSSFRCIIKGHFVFSVIRFTVIKNIENEIGKKINLDNQTLNLMLSNLVWDTVNHSDHKSLRRKINRALRSL